MMPRGLECLGGFIPVDVRIFHANYDDQFPLWRVGANLPMRWDRDSIEAAATP